MIHLEKGCSESLDSHIPWLIYLSLTNAPRFILISSLYQKEQYRTFTYYKVTFRINLLLTEREGRTGEYWPEVVAVRTERSEVRTKTTEGQYSPVRLEQARLVSSLLYGTRVMLVSKLPAFENKKYTSYDHFHGNGPYGKIPTKKEPIRTPGFTPRLPCHIIIRVIAWENQAGGQRWGSAKIFHINIIDRLGGLMDKYT